MTSETNFQGRSTEEGRAVQEIAEKVIKAAGFEVVERNRLRHDVGVTINFVAIDKYGDEWSFDVSGAFTSERAGLIRTDTMWKTLGRASVLSKTGGGRLVLLTTNLPKPGTVGDKAMRAASSTFFDAVEMLSPDGRLRLRRYAAGGPKMAPLPGFRTAADIYRGAVRTKNPLGASLAVPVELTGDPVHVSFGYEVVNLPHRIKVYLPSQTQGGEAIATSRRKRVGNDIKAILSEVAGGCTASDAKGSWVDPLAGVVDEDVSVVETYSKEAFSPQAVRDIVDLILADLDQHTAALIVNDQMLQFTV